MSGHSKWSTIKRAKGANDAKRSKIFAKLAREVTIAVREKQSADADMNPRLRLALLKCKSANMPGDNIERAINRALGGGEGANYEELTYEIFGPSGVGLLVEVTTDNRNRSAAEIRAVLNKNGGSIATAGAVSRLFHRKGQIIVARDAAEEDRLMEIALEAGAEDFKTEEEGYEILTDPSDFEKVHTAITEKGIECEAAQVTALPTLTTPVGPDAAPAVQRLIEALEDNDDVNEVYSTAEYSD